MEVSREMMIREIESIRRDLLVWEKELKKPTLIDAKGKEKLEFKDNVIPKGLSVSSFRAIPVPQLRAELTVLAHKLEALAST